MPDAISQTAFVALYLLSHLATSGVRRATRGERQRPSLIQDGRRATNTAPPSHKYDIVFRRRRRERAPLSREGAVGARGRRRRERAPLSPPPPSNVL